MPVVRPLQRGLRCLVALLGTLSTGSSVAGGSHRGGARLAHCVEGDRPRGNVAEITDEDIWHSELNLDAGLAGLSRKDRGGCVMGRLLRDKGISKTVFPEEAKLFVSLPLSRHWQCPSK